MMIDKFAISSKVKELATHIATTIRKKRAAFTVTTHNSTNTKNENTNVTSTASTTPTNPSIPSYLTRVTPPGLVSAASILLAAQLEGVPLKSMSEICNSTGLSEETLQSYYKELVANVGQLLPPNYIPSSKVWIYLKTGIDQGYIPSPLLSPLHQPLTASPSLSLSPLSLTRHPQSIPPPDMAAIQMDSKSPPKETPLAQKNTSAKAEPSTTPKLTNTPKMLLGQPFLMLPPSPLFVARRGSVQVLNAMAEKTLDILTPANINVQSRRASIATTPSSPSMKKIAVQIDSNNFVPELSLNSWKTGSNSDSAIVAAAIASLSSSVDIPENEKEKTIEQQQQQQQHYATILPQPQSENALPFRKFTRRFSSQSNAVQLPHPNMERRSSLGRRSTIANEDHQFISPKRSKMGIHQLLNSSSSSLPISPTLRECESDSSDC